MKVATLSLILSCPSVITAASIRGQKEKQTHAKSVNIGECSGAAILLLIQENPHFSEALHALDSPAEAAIDELCNHRSLSRTLQDTESIPFSHVTARGRQFDKNYFDGGSDWNTGLAGTSKETNAGRIPAVASALSSKQLSWPSHIVNFDDSDSCQLRTAMCCFTKAQDPSTGVVSNINDATAFQNAIQPNADVCTVHLDRSPQAGHVTNGKTYYSDGRSVEDETKDAYCTGFFWSQDQDDISTQYRANTLFHISMMDSFYNNNLVGGVPGAPMCGCVEQMPVVSHANCVKPSQARRLSVSSNSGDDKPRLLLDASLDFVPCEEEESLVVAFAAANNAEEAEALSKIVTGSCVDAVDEDLTAQSYKRGSAWWHADEESWIPIIGNKFLYHPEMSAEDVKAAFETSSTKTIRRICTSCSPSHRDVYYKRLTAVPDSLDLLNMLKDSFSSVDNILGTDFTISSKDKNGSSTPWTHCEYSDARGFPYQCGPDGTVTKQWTSTKSGATYAKIYAYYIEK